MRWFWRFRARREQELTDEIQSHIAMATRDRIERGEMPQAAKQSALREFGNRTLVCEATRQSWGGAWLERVWQDSASNNKAALLLPQRVSRLDPQAAAGGAERRQKAHRHHE